MEEMEEMEIWSLSWEDPLEEEMATQSSILAWRIPWAEEFGGLHSWGHNDWYITEQATEHAHLFWLLCLPFREIVRLCLLRPSDLDFSSGPFHTLHRCQSLLRDFSPHYWSSYVISLRLSTLYLLTSPITIIPIFITQFPGLFLTSMLLCPVIHHVCSSDGCWIKRTGN